MVSDVVVRAEVFEALAEALAEPPAWLAEAGHNWLLFKAVARAAQDAGSAAACRAAPALASIPPESLEARFRRYWQIFAGSGRPKLWPYESMHVDGRLLGPTSFAVQQVYRAAGLEVEGAELPDHASMELAFLGWLGRQEAAYPAQAGEWQQLARRFISRHAGRWLPHLGRALAATSDPVYGPIGQLLADWLVETGQPAESHCATRLVPQLPTLFRPDACTLCGFCAQVCPTDGLVIHETDKETGLVLDPAACVGCGKCERVCEFGALQLETRAAPGAGPVALCISPRATCAGCGQPTVSRAELEAIAAGIGEWPHWLDYCLECRPIWQMAVSR